MGLSGPSFSKIVGKLGIYIQLEGECCIVGYIVHVYGSILVFGDVIGNGCK